MPGETGPEYLTQSGPGYRLQQAPELVGRQVSHLAQRRSRYQAILDLGRAGLRLHRTKLNLDRHIERPAVRRQMLDPNPARKHRPDVAPGLRVNAGDAHKARLHPGEVVDDDAHRLEVNHRYFRPMGTQVFGGETAVAVFRGGFAA